MEQFIGKHPRIEAVDALRGFAVMAILLVHNLEHFIFPVYPADSPGWLNALDQGVFNVVFTLFARKGLRDFRPPVRIHVLHSKRQPEAAGRGLRLSFPVRLVLLAGFATLNAAFFPAGDVLLLFVIAGLVLFLRATGATGYPRRRRRFPVAACRMVPLHSRPAESGPPVARSGGR